MAPMDRETCIELPQEDKLPEDGDAVGLLLRSMYGFRTASANWMRAWQATLEQGGYERTCVERKRGSVGFWRRYEVQELCHEVVVPCLGSSELGRTSEMFSLVDSKANARKSQGSQEGCTQLGGDQTLGSSFVATNVSEVHYNLR